MKVKEESKKTALKLYVQKTKIKKNKQTKKQRSWQPVLSLHGK